MVFGISLFLPNFVTWKLPHRSQFSTTSWGRWGQTHASSETREGSQLHHVHITALFCINELPDARDWLELLWLTGQREYAIPLTLRAQPILASTARSYGIGFIRISTPDRVMTGQTHPVGPLGSTKRNVDTWVKKVINLNHCVSTEKNKTS